jgi:hypothetical protein
MWEGCSPEAAPCPDYPEHSLARTRCRSGPSFPLLRRAKEAPPLAKTRRGSRFAWGDGTVNEMRKKWSAYDV